MYEDIYFLNSEEALRVAKEQNRSGEDDVKYVLQCCYYDGQKIESDLVNLIHLPIDNLLEGLTYGRYRIPTKIEFSGLNLSYKMKVEIVSYFNMTIEQVKQYRIQLYKQHLESLRNTKLNFNEKWRFYLTANSQTTVMQYVSKSIANTLKSLGYEVFYDLYYGIEDNSSFKNIYEFNPHVTININHLNNNYFGDDVFNFVWYQDPMPILFNNNPIKTRKRDVIFTYTQHYKALLENKDVEVAFEYPIPADLEIFYNKNYKRKDTIVFVGTYYNEQNIVSQSKIPNQFIDVLYDYIQTRGIMYKDGLKKLFEDNCLNFPDDAVLASIIQGLVRNKCVEWMCECIDDSEVYGRNFEDKKLIKDNYKYEIKHGEELANIYNSFKYALVPSILVNSQRLSEVSACGCIPVVYDAQHFTVEDNRWEDYCLFFSSKEELSNIVNNNLKPKLDASCISQELSYKNLVQRFIDIINQRITDV